MLLWHNVGAMKSNEEWLHELSATGEIQELALVELRDYLLRAVYIYLRDRRPDLSKLDSSELYEMAEDFAQEALVAIQNNLENFRGDSKFTTWAYRFVINRAIDELRGRQYGHLSVESLTEQETAVFLPLTQAKQYTDPDLTAERRDIIQKILDILQSSLNERQRVAMLRVHFEEHSMPEVANDLNMTTNALYKLLHDARKKVKAELKARHLSEGDIMAIFENSP
jgi:RNA polymerase sigma-70 factor (ECF subfamily)